MIKLKYLNPANVINYILRIRRKPVRVTREQLYESYKSVFLRSPEGRIVLEHLSRLHFVGKQTFHRDERQSAFNEGQRFVVESIIHVISNDLEALKKLSEQINVSIEEE